MVDIGILRADRCRSISVLAVCLAGLAAAHAETGSPNRDFDGQWDTVVSCPNSHGALGYVYDFVSTVDRGHLHGEHGKRSEPGWLRLEGDIAADGTSELLATGLVGAAPFAVGSRPAGTEYAYHVDAHFERDRGTGHRVEGRSCSVTFTRNQ